MTLSPLKNGEIQMIPLRITKLDDGGILKSLGKKAGDAFIKIHNEPEKGSLGYILSMCEDDSVEVMELMDEVITYKVD